MDNFGLLKKRELSYVLNNENKFGTRLIDQIESYCQRRRFSIKRIKDKIPEWEENINRLKCEIGIRELKISRTVEAQKADVNKYTFGMVAVFLILFFSIWHIFGKKDYDFEFWYELLVIPFLIAFLYKMVVKRKELKEKLLREREIRIFKTSSVQLFENKIKIKESQIIAVNLFWTEDQEAGSTPDAKLELKIGEREVVQIDEGGNYLELLNCGNEIGNFLNMKLNVFHGKSPFKNKIEL